MKNKLVDLLKKKPAQARSAQTVETIIDATAQVFEEDGEKGATTNRIAERAGYSVGTLYQYFPDKEAIFKALIKREFESVRARMRAALKDTQSLDEAETARVFVRLLTSVLKGRLNARRALLKRAARLGVLDWVESTVPEIMGEMLSELRWHERYPQSMSKLRFHILSRAVLGAVRLTVIENPHMIATQAFEDELVTMIVAYVKSPAVG